MIWYEKQAERFSPVISTRVRFARNLEEFPFPHRLNAEGKEKVWEKIEKVLTKEGFTAHPFSRLSQAEKEAFVEQRLSSAALLKSTVGAGVLLSPEKDISVMVNEEDHIRLQVLSVGKKIEETLEKAGKLEEILRRELSLAYRPGLGYLTSCPTNLGAGLRISVMIHLPALTRIGAITNLAESLGHRGFTVRGVLGEGSRATGGIYQISNQQSREMLPRDIAQAFLQVLAQVEEAEQKAAQKLLETEKEDLLDQIMRSIGILSFARKMSYSEFAEHFALIRFGKALGLEEARGVFLPDRLFFALSPANLVLEKGEYLPEEKRDLERCRLLQKEWKKE